MVVWIDQQSAIAYHFRQTGLISGNDRSPALHCFNYRQAKTFVIRRINETGRGAIKRGQIAFLNIAGENDVTLSLMLAGDAQSLVVKPAALSRDYQLRSLLFQIAAPQHPKGSNQSREILARLDRSERQNVIALYSVSLPNSQQFRFVAYRGKVRGRSQGRYGYSFRIDMVSLNNRPP